MNRSCVTYGQQGGGVTESTVSVAFGFVASESGTFRVFALVGRERWGAGVEYHFQEIS